MEGIDCGRGDSGSPLLTLKSPSLGSSDGVNEGGGEGLELGEISLHFVEQTTFAVSVEEAVRHFQKNLKVGPEIPSLQLERKPQSWTRWFRITPKLNSVLKEEQDLVYLMAKSSFDWSDKLQIKILQTLYTKLTTQPCYSLERGNHWQKIGFQGIDPGTDLRGVGLFGLTQFLYLTSEELLPFTRRLFTVSNSDSQPFPLAVLSLNVTSIVMVILDSGKLNREINSRNSVIDTLNAFYSAVLAYYFNIWVTQKKTLPDSGYLLRDVERYCSRNVRRVLKDLPGLVEKYSVTIT